MPPIIFLAIAIVAVGILVLIAITLSSKHSYTFDVEEYQTKWLKVENGLVKADPRTYNMAVIEADKLLDKALNEMGTPGKTMGEHMKRVNDRFEKPNAVWSAHKLRNQIAHEHGFEADYGQASRALSAFRQALKDLGAI